MTADQMVRVYELAIRLAQTSRSLGVRWPIQANCSVCIASRRQAGPLSGEAVRVLEQSRRKRESIGDGWLFPSPEDSSKPCSRHLLRDWWRRAEKLAEMPRTARLGWHSLRRKFVNDMKADTPMADLCYLGGWKSPLTVMTVYQQADQVTMRNALSNRDKRRAVGA